MKTLWVGKRSGKTRQLARKELFLEIRALAPHETICTCSVDSFEMGVHMSSCPRKWVDNFLKALENR